MSTTTLDLQWLGRPQAIASALLEIDGRHALVDPGPESTLAELRKALDAKGLGVGDIDAILITHIHLDHAGATGSLVRENPKLPVHVHRLGAPHMIDPSKLLASAGRLWGDDLPRLFGTTLPVPQENLRILEGGENIAVGSRKLDVVYTPGHASHHVSYFDDVEGTAFVGDTAGIHLEGSAYVMPATPPPDIDLELWDSSFAAILGRRPARLFLTHFGFSENPPAHIVEFRERLRVWARIAGDVVRDAPNETAAATFVKAAKAEIAKYLPEAGVEQYAFTAGIDLSFLGLARYLRKRSPERAEKSAS